MDGCGGYEKRDIKFKRCKEVGVKIQENLMENNFEFYYYKWLNYELIELKY